MLNYSSSKFCHIDLPNIYAKRDKLMKEYDTASLKPWIYIYSPAGYGKTFSTVIWLMTRQITPVWINLDIYDNSLSEFYKLFCTALYFSQPDNDLIREIIMSDNFSVSPENEVINLISKLSTKKKYAIVLDDLHYIINKEIYKSFMKVMKIIPSNYNLFFLARLEIAGVDSFPEMKNYLSFIDHKQLLFDKEEIQNYYNSLQRKISSKDCDIVNDISRGWAVAVNVMAKNQNYIEHINNENYLEHYFEKNIWSDMNEDLKEFIIKTVIVKDLNRDICTKLTGQKDCEKILEYLSENNLLLSKQGFDNYKYNILFSDILLKILERNKFDLNNLYNLCSEYYYENKQFLLCMDYAFKSSNSYLIEKVYIENYTYNNQNSSVDLSMNIFLQYSLNNTLEQNLVNNPFIYISYTWYYYLNGNANKFIYYMDKLYENLDNIFLNNNLFSLVSIIITAFDFRKKITNNVIPKYLDKIIEKSDRTVTTMSLTQNLPIAHRSHRDYSYFGLDLATNISMFRDCFCFLLDTNYEIFEKTLLAGLYYEKNELALANKYIKIATSYINDETVSELKLCVYFLKAVIFFAFGKNELADKMIKYAYLSIIKDNSLYLLNNFNCCEAKYLLLNCDTQSAQKWLDNYYVVHPAKIELYKSFQHFITLRCYIILNKYELAIDLTTKLKKFAIDFRRPLDFAEVSVLESILLWYNSKEKEALAVFSVALIKMQKLNFIRIFSEEGSSIIPMLKNIIKKVKKQNYIGKIDLNFLLSVYHSSIEQSKLFKGMINNSTINNINLTQQQKKMIVFLSKGYTQNQISECTKLSVNTVKAHISAAYLKLNVTSADDAIFKCVELGIIN